MTFIKVIEVIFLTQLLAVTGKSHGEFGPVEVSAKIGYLYHKYKQSEDDKTTTAAVLKVLQNATQFIHTGIGHMPPLDPYTIGKLLPINIDSSVVKGTLHLTNLVIRSVSEGNLENFQMYAAPSRVEFDIIVPSVIGSVHIDAINMETGCLTFNLSTDLTITLQNVRMAGIFSIMPDPALNRYQATGLETSALIKDIEYDLSVNVGCIPVAIRVEILKGIHESVNRAIFEDLNQLLLDYTILEMQRLLQPKEKIKNLL